MRYGMANRDSVSNRIPEWKLQAAIAAHLDKIGQPFAASLEGVIGSLNPYQSQLAKATGVKRGEPDIRLYFDQGRLVPVELKGESGSLSPEQKERIPMLRDLGFTVHIIRVASEADAVAAIAEIVALERATPGGSGGLASASYFPKQRIRPLT
jgi:hypothetical protein